MTDKRFNRFSVVGVGASNNDVFLESETFMSRTFAYIRRLFLTEVNLTIPRPQGQPPINCLFKLFDRFYSTNKISPVEAFSFGGFKNTASARLRQQLGKVTNPSNNQENVNS